MFVNVYVALHIQKVSAISCLLSIEWDNIDLVQVYQNHLTNLSEFVLDLISETKYIFCLRKQTKTGLNIELNQPVCR